MFSFIGKKFFSTADDICEFTFLSPKELQNLAANPPSLKCKKFIFTQNQLGEFKLFVLNKGNHQWLREIAVDSSIKDKLLSIFAGNLPKQNNIELTVSQKAKLLDLVLAYEKIGCILSANVPEAPALDLLTNDTYIIVVSSSREIRLYFYDSDLKEKILLISSEAHTARLVTFVEIKQVSSSKVTSHPPTYYPVTADEIKIIRDQLNSIIKEAGGNLSDENVNSLRKSLLFYHQPSKSIKQANSYKLISKTIANYKKNYETLLSRYLDKEVWQSYFNDERKNSNSKYVIVNGIRDKKIKQYQDLNESFENARVFFLELSNLHEPLINITSGKDALFQARSLYGKFMSVLELWCNTSSNMEAIGLVQLLQNIFSFAGMQHVLAKIFPFDANQLIDLIQKNAFYVSFNSHAPDWIKLFKNFSANLSSLQTILGEISANLPEEGDAKENIQLIISELNQMLISLDKFNHSTKSYLKLAQLIVRVYPKFTSLIDKLPKGYIALRVSLKGHVAESLQIANLICKKVGLLADCLEVQHYLREGCLLQYPLEGVSLASIIENFNKKVNEWGYEFELSDQYPYTYDILSQRMALLTSDPESLILVKRIESQKLLVKSLEDKLNQQNEKVDRDRLSLLKADIAKLFHDRRDQLQSETKKFFVFNRKRKEEKIKFLSENLIILESLSAESDVKELVNKCFEAKSTIINGRTGKMLKDAKSKFLTRNDIFSCLKKEIINCENELKKKYFFFAKWRKSRILKRLSTLQHLSELLEASNGRVDIALRDMSALRSESYKLLINRDKKFINGLRQMGQTVNRYFPSELKKIPRLDVSSINSHHKNIRKLSVNNESLDSNDDQANSIFDLYDNIKQSIVGIKSYLLQQYSLMLDSNCFENTLNDSPKDEKGRYIVPRFAIDENDILLDYQRVINVLINAEILIDKLSLLHKITSNSSGKFDVSKMLGNPLSLYNLFWEWLDSYRNLHTNLESLNIFTLLLQCSNPAKLKEITLHASPLRADTYAQLQSHPLISWLKSYAMKGGGCFVNNAEILPQIHNFYHDLSVEKVNRFIQYVLPTMWKEQISQLDAKLVEEDNKVPNVSEIKSSIHQAVTHIRQILILMQNYAMSRKSLLRTLIFAYRFYPHLQNLLKITPQSLRYLNFIYKDHLVNTFKLINNIFKDIVICFDKIGIQYFLKDNYLLDYSFNSVSLANIMQTFNDWVESAGLQFDINDRYPYLRAIVDARKAVSFQDVDQQQFITKRIAELDDKLNKQKMETTRLKDDQNKTWNYHRQLAIDTFNNKGKLKTPQERLTREALNYTSKDRAKLIQEESESSPIAVTNPEAKKSLIKIARLLKQPGYRIDDALLEIGVKNPSRYNLVKKKYGKLFDKIRTIEELLPASQIELKLIR